MTLFLIAHKVRGLPAFDIAERCNSMGTLTDPGPWWIIPTSGHRAWPYWWRELNELLVPEFEYRQVVMEFFSKMPESLPDHYPRTASTKPKPKPIDHINLEDLL